MRLLSFKGFLHTLYGVGFTFVAIAAFLGFPYYTLSIGDRPHSEMHQAFKPGGLWGHGLGVIGSTMVLLLFLYSLRKRRKMGLRFGRVSRWLDIHIFFGIIGPLLITLHTAMKFGGIVSISYFSMVIVALSGVFGRYVYMQIPRDARGDKMDLAKARETLSGIKERMASDYHVAPKTQAHIDRFVRVSADENISGFLAVTQALWKDATLSIRARMLRRALVRDPKVPTRDVAKIMELAKADSLLGRRIVMLTTMTRVFHYWHVFHKPFAYIMVGIMFLHVAIAVSFGYTWVF